MRRSPIRALLVAALVAAAVAVASPASAAQCRAGNGVTVVADYGRSRGVDVRCAPGDPVSGLAALTGAGLPYTFVPRQPGLVCTINGVPDPCNGAPPDAYWSYWHLRPDRTWAYSDTGAGSYDPAPGAVEGRAFGSGRPPRVPRSAAPSEGPAAVTPTGTVVLSRRRPRRR